MGGTLKECDRYCPQGLGRLVLIFQFQAMLITNCITSKEIGRWFLFCFVFPSFDESPPNPTHPHPPPPTQPALSFFCFFKWRSAPAHQFHSSRQDQSTVVERSETTVDEHPLTSSVWARFPNRFPHYAWTAQSTHSDFAGSKVHACLAVTCLLHF